MKKDRLLKLAEVLENFETERKNLVVSVDRFDLGTWADGISMNGALHRERGCGTAACAVGTAMLHPYFRRRGLRCGLEINGYSMAPAFGEAELAYYAAAAFFDIGEGHARHLFSEVSYPERRRGPKSVAKRIREFVATVDEVHP